jgi:hypothetical protein
MCKVIVKNSLGSRTITSDWAVAVLPLSGSDLNGDGIPDLLLETYTGGVHCCWNYWIVGLGERPTVEAHFYNQRIIDFSHSLRGVPTIETVEGGFDYLRTSHAGSFFPGIYLQLQGSKLFDISCEFTSKFDREIENARTELHRLDPDNHAANSDADDAVDDSEQIRHDILAIISSYLYSNRPQKAWATLNTYWPKEDRAALKAKILKIRREGILKLASRKSCRNNIAP